MPAPTLRDVLGGDPPDRASAIDAIREDLFPHDELGQPVTDAGLNGAFEPDPDPDAVEYLPGLELSDITALLDHPVSAVAWRATLRHIGPFRGIPATGRLVVIDGVSLLDVRSGDGVIHRFVNWEEAMAQIGVVYALRGATTANP